MADLKTEAIILKRVNFNESDRIVTFLTPEGCYSAIARGVRREKSKLAGGIEMFSLVKIVLHQRDSNRVVISDLSDQFGILTSAKPVEFYQNIISNLETLDLAANFLKQTSRATRQISSKELFILLQQSLYYLNYYVNDPFKTQLISIYFKINLSRICGEEINVFYDRDGQKLEASSAYDWDGFERVLVKNSHSGSIDQNIIKLLRLILTTQLAVVLKVKNIERFLPTLSRFV